MPYLAPKSYNQARAENAAIDSQEQENLVNMLKASVAQQQLGRQDQLRSIYQSGRQPTIQELGSYNPELAITQQNNESLQQSRETDDMLKRHNALKGIMTQFKNTALRNGFNPSDQSTYGILERIRPQFDGIISSITGQPPSKDPVNWDAVESIADMTPGEQFQQKLAQEQQLKQIGNQYDLERERGIQGIRSEEELNRERASLPFKQQFEDYKANLDINKQTRRAEAETYQKKLELDQQADRDYIAATQAIDEALPLTGIATQSGFGHNLDQAAAYFGASTEGADAAAALKTIGARMVGFQPKMSGPQSDRDAALYREMSGQIGDDTLPMSRRLKALQVVKNLMDTQAEYRKTGKYQAGASGSWGNNNDAPEGWTDEDEAEYQRVVGGK